MKEDLELDDALFDEAFRAASGCVWGMLLGIASLSALVLAIFLIYFLFFA
jgi:uncharacterized membrane protein